MASLHRLAHEVFERAHDVVHARVDALASRQRSIEIVRPLHQQNEVRTSFRKRLVESTLVLSRLPPGPAVAHLDRLSGVASVHERLELEGIGLRASGHERQVPGQHVERRGGESTPSVMLSPNARILVTDSVGGAGGGVTGSTDGGCTIGVGCVGGRDDRLHTASVIRRPYTARRPAYGPMVRACMKY